MIETEQVVADLLSAHETGQQVAPAVSELSRAQILAIQARVCAQLGPVAGFKVGRVADDLPTMAPIAARYCVPNGAARPVARRFAVELEVGFTLIRALPGSGLPSRPQDYFKPCAALELVDTRLSGAAAERPDLKFADSQINAGLVCGDLKEDWDGADFGEVEIRLEADHAHVADGPITVPGGSALSNLDLLLSHLDGHCGGLQVGQTVITGSLCGLPYFDPGTHVSGWIKGLGAVSVTLARLPVQAI